MRLQYCGGLALSVGSEIRARSITSGGSSEISVPLGRTTLLVEGSNLVRKIRALSTGANVAEAQIKSGAQYRTGEASDCKVQRQVQRKDRAPFRAWEAAGSGYWIKSA